MIANKSENLVILIKKEVPEIHSSLLKYVEKQINPGKKPTSMGYIDLGDYFARTLFLNFENWLYCYEFVADPEEGDTFSFNLYNPEETKLISRLVNHL